MGSRSPQRPGGKPGTPDRPPPPSAHVTDPAAERIPAALKRLGRWVIWRWVWKAKKDQGRGGWDKPPVAPRSGRPTDATDPSAWMPFEEARALARQLGDGIGLALGAGGAGEALTGVDLDGVLGATGEIAPWALAVVRRLNSYTERTPSGRGLRVWVRGRLPRGANGKPRCRTLKRPGLEFYDRDRYFTVTGDVWDGSPPTIEDRQAELDALHAETFGTHGTPKAQAGPAPDLADDDDLLRRARAARNGAKFAALFDRGDLSGYGGDESAADFALCSLLGFWTGDDAARVERIFNRSALGQRAKWRERADYRALTIANALASRGGTSTPPKPTVHGAGRPEGGGVPPEPPAAAPTAQAQAPSQFPLTDLGNAERLVALHGKDLRHCHPWGKWLVWDGRRWEIDQTAAVGRMAKGAVRSIYTEAADTEDDQGRIALAKWGKASESRQRMDALLALAAAEPSIPVLPEQLDQNPWLLNCPNGTIDLKSGALGRPYRHELITKMCPVEYDPEAGCPLWEATLHLVFGGNAGLIAFWRRLCGLCLTGVVTEQVLPILHGSGSNGKSTLLGVLLELLGPDYALKAPPELLLVKGQSHPTERAALFGRRLVVGIETAEGGRLDEVMVKELTGGDTLTARRMREDFWSFRPTHKLLLCTNHKPEVRGTDHAIWRRLLLIPFGVQIAADQAVKDMPERLACEYPGILGWCVRGCLEWQRGGLNPPPEVGTATAEYRTGEDVLGAFLDEHCICDAGNESVRVKAGALYERYRQWAESSGEAPVNQRRFGNALSERGFRRLKDSVKWYVGIGLRQTEGGAA